MRSARSIYPSEPNFLLDLPSEIAYISSVAKETEMPDMSNFSLVLLNLTFTAMLIAIVPSLAFALANSTSANGRMVWPMLLRKGVTA
jgi:hypothetical protein